MADETTYMLYDRETGAPLATHTYVDLESGASQQVSLRRAKRDLRMHIELPDGVRADVLEVRLPEGAAAHEYRVDPRRKRRVAKPTLLLHADRTCLEGDGEDTVTIEISATDHRGRVARTAACRIHVSTTRGRLSARGGNVELRRGVARVDLTSAAETVDSVVVIATDPAGLLLPGRLELEFV